MANRTNTGKQLVSISLLALGFTAVKLAQASSPGANCNEFYQGRCEQWCIDNNHGGMMSCHVNANDHPVCVCSEDGGITFFS